MGSASEKRRYIVRLLSLAEPIPRMIRYAVLYWGILPFVNWHTIISIHYIYPCSSRLLHWYWDNRTFTPVTIKRPWSTDISKIKWTKSQENAAKRDPCAWDILISYHVISCCALPYRVVSYRIINHMIWYDMIWYDMIWYDMIYHIMSHHTHHNASNHILRHVTSYPMLNHSKSHYITSKS